MLNSTGISSTTSGSRPAVQPSANAGADGRSASLPRGAPPSTQRTIVSICSFDRLRSLRIFKLCSGSAPHGGISRATTLFLMTRAHGRTSSYERNVIGATSPVRWHIVHFAYMIGAMSFVNVGTLAGAVWTGVQLEAATATVPARTNRARFIRPSGQAHPACVTGPECSLLLRSGHARRARHRHRRDVEAADRCRLDEQPFDDDGVSFVRGEVELRHADQPELVLAGGRR